MTVLEGWEYRCSGGDGMLLDQKVGRGGDSRGKFRLSEVGRLYYVIYVIYVIYYQSLAMRGPRILVFKIFYFSIGRRRILIR